MTLHCFMNPVRSSAIAGLFFIGLCGFGSSCNIEEAETLTPEKKAMNMEPAPAATEPAAPPRSSLDLARGRVHADDYPDIQAAVDALGENGGVVMLGPRRYELQKPLKLRRKIVLQGVMDAKVARSSSVIAPARGFEGAWLIETDPLPARENHDLNPDFGFYDLNLLGSATIGGIRGANLDIMRIERCRLAYMRVCVELTQVTDLPRPFPSKIVPGGLFINNCIFQATEICLNLEYTTQNRIFANWFVSNSGVVLRLLNSNKTWFFANEINQFNRAGILLEDDGQPGNPIHDIFLTMNWIHSVKPETRYIEIVNGDRIRNLVVTDNIFSGKAQLDWPFRGGERGCLLANNLGSAARSEAIGQVVIPAGQLRAEFAHGLRQEPIHVATTPWGPVNGTLWIERVDESRLAVVLPQALDRDLTVSWEARSTP